MRASAVPPLMYHEDVNILSPTHDLQGLIWTSNVCRYGHSLQLRNSIYQWLRARKRPERQMGRILVNYP